MDVWALESPQVCMQPLITALCPHVCLCMDTLVCRDLYPWNPYPRQWPHSTHWPIKHSLANGFLFQLEEKSPPRLLASRKGEFIGSAQSHKGGKGPQEVSGLTPRAENGELWMQTMLYRAFPTWVSKALKGTYSPTFLGDLSEHSIFSLKYFFLYTQSETYLVPGNLLGFILHLLFSRNSSCERWQHERRLVSFERQGRLFQFRVRWTLSSYLPSLNFTFLFTVNLFKW